MSRPMVTIDGNEAAAYVAHKTNEVIAIYPITPSSPMGEWSDQWSAEMKPNVWGTIPVVVELQSEGGASGTVHGSLQAGALTTTFTSSQGIPRPQGRNDALRSRRPWRSVTKPRA